MVTFQKPVRWTLFDLAHMERELEEILGRKVDLTDRTAVEQTRNYIRRRAILDSARTVYAAG
jgi:predicted nucleotidyltransferase